MSDSSSSLSSPPSSPAPPQAFTLHPATVELLNGLRDGHVDLPVPELVRPENPRDSSISKYMQKMDVPMAFDLVSVDKYLNLATIVANEIERRSQAEKRQILDPKLMSSEDKVLLVENEAGVFAYNERHFMRVYDACIKACWSDIGNDEDTRFYRTVERDFRTEENWPTPNQNHPFHVKPDGAWFRVAEGQIPENNSDHTRCVSVYELKNTDVIYMSCVNLHPLTQSIPRNSTRRLRQGGVYSAHRSLQLSKPSVLLIQQAASYAIAFRTQYVAMYDYSTLLLIRFTDLETSTTLTIGEAFLKGGVGNRFEITVVTDKSVMVPALTGFLYQAQRDEMGLGMPSGVTTTETA